MTPKMDPKIMTQIQSILTSLANRENQTQVRPGQPKYYDFLATSPA